jgi:hypothetical protein
LRLGGWGRAVCVCVYVWVCVCVCAYALPAPTRHTHIHTKQPHNPPPLKATLTLPPNVSAKASVSRRFMRWAFAESTRRPMGTFLRRRMTEKGSAALVVISSRKLWFCVCVCVRVCLFLNVGGLGFGDERREGMAGFLFFFVGCVWIDGDQRRDGSDQGAVLVGGTSTRVLIPTDCRGAPRPLFTHRPTDQQVNKPTTHDQPTNKPTYQPNTQTNKPTYQQTDTQAHINTQHAPVQVVLRDDARVAEPAAVGLDAPRRRRDGHVPRPIPHHQRAAHDLFLIDCSVRRAERLCRWSGGVE